MHRLVTVALVHTCFPCSQTCRAHLITLLTHSRWLKSLPKNRVALDSVSVCVCECVWGRWRREREREREPWAPLELPSSLSLPSSPLPPLTTPTHTPPPKRTHPLGQLPLASSPLTWTPLGLPGHPDIETLLSPPSQFPHIFHSPLTAPPQSPRTDTPDVPNVLGVLGVRDVPDAPDTGLSTRRTRKGGTSAKKKD